MPDSISRSRLTAPLLAPAAVRALVAAAQRRRLLDGPGAARLREAAAAAGAADPDALRRWLGQGRLAGADPAALCRLLPAPGAIPFGAFPPLAHLAAGGMGAVWLTCLGDGLTLGVLKVLPGGDAPDLDRLRRRFAREVSVTRKLHHPNVLRCLDGGTGAAGPFLVLEYVPSGTLDDLVAARGRLPEGVALALAYQVADGLSEAHRQHLVHRDVKPGNIFVTPDGTAKIADFGIARMEDAEGNGLTMAGTVLGSPFYMAPEQVRGEPVGMPGDIYSLGCVLHFCLAGAPPYPGRPHEVMRAHEVAPPPDLAAAGVRVHPATAAVVARCMAKQPAGRFADMLELRAALAEARQAAGGPDPAAWFGIDLVEEPARDPVPILFREPEELLALIEARQQQQSGPATTRVVATDRVEAVEKPRRPRTETVLSPPWLALLSDASGRGAGVHLFGKREVVIGKLAKPPVDITALLYPIALHLGENQQISRSHCALRCTAAGWEAEDLGSNNGSALDGRPLAAKAPAPLLSGRRHRLDLGGVQGLELAALPARDAGMYPPPAADAASDGLVVRRLGNRPELGYAVVVRLVRIGGQGADVVLPGADAGAGCELSLGTSGWHWRRWSADGAAGPWELLTAGTYLDCAGVSLCACVGEHRHFTS